MSRIFDALRQSELETQSTGAQVEKPAVDLMREAQTVGAELDTVPRLWATPNERVLSLRDEGGYCAEKFRVLTIRLKNMRGYRELRSVHITSATTGEGKSLVALNLTVTAAKHSNNRVLLIDGDLRKPTIHSLLGIAPGKGLGDWHQSGATSVRPYLCRLENVPLWVLQAGNAYSPSDVLQSQRLSELMGQLVTQFDWVIVDSPPLLPMADANQWSRLTDGTLLVVREGTTPKRALEKGLESLDNPKLVGVVLNDASGYDHVHHYDRYYSGQHKRSATQPETAAEEKA